MVHDRSGNTHTSPLSQRLTRLCRYHHHRDVLVIFAALGLPHQIQAIHHRRLNVRKDKIQGMLAGHR
jgi:hypothetical protein